jgi:hypothetical protein
VPCRFPCTADQKELGNFADKFLASWELLGCSIEEYKYLHRLGGVEKSLVESPMLVLGYLNAHRK